MKTIKNIGVKLFAAVALLFAVPTLASAQNYNTSAYNNYYLNADWNFNIPLGNDFASKASGWGMNFDAGYYLTDNFGLGAFLAFNTNHKYIPTQSFMFENSTMTTNQQHSVFQLPFGVSARYRMVSESIFEPYVSMKLGANYAQMASYFSTFKAYDRTWGFYMSPEVGTNIWLTPNQTVGLHLALYYSFATNKGNVLNYSMDNLNNFGFRVGLCF